MFYYLMKYITKSWTEESNKHIKTLAMLSYFDRHSFSFSKRFFEDCKAQRSCADLIYTAHNSYFEFEFIGVMQLTEAKNLIDEFKKGELELLRRQNNAIESFIP